ncbi:putative glycosyltransferase family 2 protein [Coniochaeta sp. 2T2.1]|nr:putative glycosyltransferase family 2 protein [Coniochaeta sp. 2T2.1]
MVNYLGTKAASSGWIQQSALSDPLEGMGVFLRQSRGQYVCTPEPIDEALLVAVQRLNVGVALTMRPSMLESILNTLEPGQTLLRMKDGSQLQIVPSVASINLSSVKKFQYCCLVRQERMVLVWQDQINQILSHASRIEEKLLAYVWGDFSIPSLNSPSTASSLFRQSILSLPTSAIDEKLPGSAFENNSTEQLEEVERPESLDRPVMLHSAIFVGLGVLLGIVLVFGVSVGGLISEVFMDGNFTRLGLLLTAPLLLFAGMFFFQVIFANLWQIFGPISGSKTNSRFYSCIKPSLRQAYAQGFNPPHITIQMPVYKEGLEGVIMPTVKSLQAAISHYESHGGSASIFVNDDGMRVISEEEAQRRKEFYHDNNIGWVARPKHNHEGYIRKGKFKKASNMNFALNISQKVEGYLQEIVASRSKTGSCTREYVDEQDLEVMYEEALARVLRENPNAQAAGNIRMGEFILIVDSDTRVPVDCLLYGAAEMFLSPEVAIVQHSTGVMQVTHDFFENGITFFTNMVYSTIRFSIGAGEVAPFVGHNAFLRWAAVQDVGVQGDGYVAYWSESHVSEDFDIALRLQIKGNTVRVASYHGDGFQEGVSLTIYDEIARWQKYAYGCSEMIFHPLYKWPTRGPFTPLFRTFLGSSVLISSKFSIFAYICSYFAIGSELPLTLMNYFVVGWFETIDHYYTPSWKVFVALIFVFNVCGYVALATMRYRTGERSLLGALFENFKWVPLMVIFFGGLSFHVALALLAHLFHIDMQWGATSKEKEDSNFFQEIPRIFATFKYMYIFVSLISGAMIYLSLFAPRGWEISDFTCIVPMAVVVGSHALTPLALNPSLMVFNY